MSALDRRRAMALAALAAATLVVVAARLLTYRELGGAFEFGWPDATVARYRWTSIAVTTIAGAALGVAGVLLQSLLRNPLASPWVLGVSSGAGLGVMLSIFAAAQWGFDRAYVGGDGGPALVGALLTLAIVYALGQKRGLLDPVTVILIGVVVATICGGVITLLQHLVPFGLRGDLVTWMMGNVRQGAEASALGAAGGVLVVALVAAVALGRAMDALALSDDEARGVGLALGPTRAALFLLAGLLTSAAVALTGPIGFVGLVAPHAARLVIGPTHRALVVASALWGALLLTAADVASQVVSIQGSRIPVGVFTALVGGPMFIALLRTRGMRT